MLESRNLTNYSDPNVAENRMELARELRDLLRRLELIRAIGVASRGATQEK
jgi:glycerol-3-phosphate O-acyltransferase